MMRMPEIRKSPQEGLDAALARYNREMAAWGARLMRQARSMNAATELRIQTAETTAGAQAHAYEALPVVPVVFAGPYTDEFVNTGGLASPKGYQYSGAALAADGRLTLSASATGSPAYVYAGSVRGPFLPHNSPWTVTIKVTGCGTLYNKAGLKIRQGAFADGWTGNAGIGPSCYNYLWYQSSGLYRLYYGDASANGYTDIASLPSRTTPLYLRIAQTFPGETRTLTYSYRLGDSGDFTAVKTTTPGASYWTDKLDLGPLAGSTNTTDISVEYDNIAVEYTPESAPGDFAFIPTAAFGEYSENHVYILRDDGNRYNIEPQEGMLVHAYGLLWQYDETDGWVKFDIAHNTLAGIKPDDHHNQVHVLATNSGLGDDHTMSGAAAGHVLRATSATTAQFAQLQHSDLGSVTADQHHAQLHGLASTADHYSSIPLDSIMTADSNGLPKNSGYTIGDIYNQVKILHSTDDWVSIINNSPSGTTFYFTPGTYTYSGTLTITDKNFTFWGAGADLSIIRITPPTTTSPCIEFSGSSAEYALTFIDIRIEVPRGDGVSITAHYHSLYMYRCKIKGTGADARYGIFASSTLAYYGSVIMLVNCVLSNYFTYSVSANQYASGTIYFQTCTINRPIYIYMLAVIEGCSFYCDGNVIRQGLGYSVITGNIFNTSGTATLIYVRDAVVFSGNLLRISNASNTAPLLSVQVSLYACWLNAWQFTNNVFISNGDCYAIDLRGGNHLVSGNLFILSGSARALYSESSYWTSGWYSYTNFVGNYIHSGSLAASGKRLVDIRRNSRSTISSNYIMVYGVDSAVTDFVGIHVENYENLDIIGNRLYVNDVDQNGKYGRMYRGIEITGTAEDRHLRIIDNHILRCPYGTDTGAAIYVSGAVNPEIRGNRIVSPMGYGIQIATGITDGVLKDNHITALGEGTMQDGVEIAQGEDWTMQGNTVRWSGTGYAMEITDASTASRVLVKDNRYVGSLLLPTDGVNNCIVYDNLEVT